MQTLERRTKSRSTGDDCAQLVLETVPLMMRVIRTEIRNRRPAELSVPQFRVLAYLRRHDGISLSDLAEHIGLTPPTTSRMIEGLVVRGLVHREASSSDRRRVVLRLTAEGRAVFDIAAEGARSRISELLSALSSEERARIKAALEMLRAVVD